MNLMAAYGRAVKLYKESVAISYAAVKQDALLAYELTNSLRQRCVEENQRFLEHWKSDHAPPDVARE
jgi:hypothetical protein